MLVGLGAVVASVGAAYLYQNRLSASSGVLESRVRQFWDAKVAGDLAKAYSLEAASRTGAIDLGGYVRKRSAAIRYQRYDIKSIAERDDAADVEVEIAYQLRYPQAGELSSGSRTTERWLKLDGEWYRETKVSPDPVRATRRADVDNP